MITLCPFGLGRMWADSGTQQWTGLLKTQGDSEQVTVIQEVYF